MSPEEIYVDEGDLVNHRITSDAPLELRLHCYNLEEEVEPDRSAELSFDAKTTGRFEVENHDTEPVSGALFVQPSWRGVQMCYFITLTPTLVLASKH